MSALAGLRDFQKDRKEMRQGQLGSVSLIFCIVSLIFKMEVYFGKEGTKDTEIKLIKMDILIQ